MIIKTTLISMGITSTSGVLAFIAGLSNFTPYLVGGVILFFYLITNEKIEKSIKSAFLIILGAIVIGYLTRSSVSLLADISEHLITITFSDMEDITNKAVKIKESVINTLSFVLAGLSYDAYKRFFGNTDKILSAAVDKATKEVEK